MTNGNTPAAAAVAAVEGVRRIEQITLENGIRLRLKPVAPFMLRAASSHLEMPKVPIVHIEEKGRDEENPNDPDYMRKRAQWGLDVANAGLNVALVLGTEVEYLPEGIIPCDSDQWIDDLRAANELVGHDIVIHTEGKGRYLDWLRQYAIATETDYFRLTRILTTGVLLSEEEVTRAAESFRSSLARATDPFGWAAEQPAPIGDSDTGNVPGDGA